MSAVKVSTVVNRFARTPTEDLHAPVLMDMSWKEIQNVIVSILGSICVHSFQQVLWTFEKLLHYVLECHQILQYVFGPFRYNTKDSFSFRYNMCEFASKNVTSKRYCLEFYQNC